ncbi:MAG: hypothetical protein GX620_06970 [Chloroflexi bacterium]|nr:hypothetical protein [Chloroflexota bacterium]
MDKMKSYHQIRGFNYTPSTARNDIEFWRDYDEQMVEQELDYAQRLGLNSARPFLAYVVYDHDPTMFLARVRHFVKAAWDRGITTMPVVWDSCFSEVNPTYDIDSADWVPNPGVQRLGPEFWPAGERYCHDVVQALGPEPGLAMWDVMNEPLMTSYIAGDMAESQRAERVDRIWSFVRHFSKVFGDLDREHHTTCGVARARNLACIGDAVDVLSFHDYRQTRAAIHAHIDEALGYAHTFGKPVFMSEMGCIARANPYDMTLQICQDRGIGWYLWELMIGSSRWRDIHGIVYPDGSVRDPSIVAAVQGFFRNRDGKAVPPNVDKEGTATRALARAAEWLSAGQTDHSAGIEIAEVIANLLEAGELIAMVQPPTVVLRGLAEETPDNYATLRLLISQWSDALVPHTGTIVKYAGQ